MNTTIFTSFPFPLPSFPCSPLSTSGPLFFIIILHTHTHTSMVTHTHTPIYAYTYIQTQPTGSIYCFSYVYVFKADDLELNNVRVTIPGED